MNIYLELLSNKALIADSQDSYKIAFLGMNSESPFYLSETGTTITRSDQGYVEFNYYYFRRNLPNKLSGVL